VNLDENDLRVVIARWSGSASPARRSSGRRRVEAKRSASRRAGETHRREMMRLDAEAPVGRARDAPQAAVAANVVGERRPAPRRARRRRTSSARRSAAQAAERRQRAFFDGALEHGGPGTRHASSATSTQSSSTTGFDASELTTRSLTDLFCKDGQTRQGGLQRVRPRGRA
jgi:hypothetical protein